DPANLFRVNQNIKPTWKRDPEIQLLIRRLHEQVTCFLGDVLAVEFWAGSSRIGGPKGYPRTRIKPDIHSEPLIIPTASICSESWADAATFASPRNTVPSWPATRLTAPQLHAVRGRRE